MPPEKKYTTQFNPSPCTPEQKKALEQAADKMGIKPTALYRQAVIRWLVDNGYLPEQPEETEDIDKVEKTQTVTLSESK